ncbi:hypothetical protein HMI54_013785, partial [Coelomomyces lativittatus]
MCRGIQLELNGKKVNAMIDTGAEVNLISADLIRLLGLEKRMEKAIGGLMNADRSPMQLEGKVRGVNAKLMNKEKPLIFYVSPKFSCDLILGRPFEKTFEMRYSSKKNEDGIVEMWNENGKWIRVPSTKGNNEEGTIGKMSCIWLHEDERSGTMREITKDKENVMVTSFMIKPKGNLLAKIRAVNNVMVGTVRKRVADKIKPVSTQILDGGNLKRLTKEE